MTYGSLFTGIGGIDLGLDRAGFECRWQAETEPYAVKVLEKHWPGVKRYGDITKVDGADLEPVDLICGGFPCQDLSQAGKQAGIEGTRSGLWFEYARLVRQLRPRYVLIENVAGLLVSDAMRRVVGELARLGYVGCWRSLRASEFGASHLRKRVFIVAHCGGERRQQVAGSAPRDEAANGGTGRDIRQQNGYHLACSEGTDVAHRERQRGERWGDGRVLEEAPAEEHREALQRQRNGHALDDSGDDLGYTANPRSARPVADQRQLPRPDGGRGPLADPGNGLLPQPRRRPEGRDGVGSGSADVADAQRTGLEERNGQREQQLRQDADTLSPGIPFAPGPSDPRWPAILRERPDLAPALAYTGHAKRKTGGSGADACAGPEDGGYRGGRLARSEPASPDEPGAAPPESEICRISDGISNRMDRDIELAMSNRTKRLGRLGNAVVPQIAEWIGHRIIEFDLCQTK